MTDKEILQYRRDLSGIYIFDTLPQDNGKREPTCLEDCTRVKQYEWISHNAEGENGEKFLHELAKKLNEVMANIRNMFTESERKQFSDVISYVDIYEFNDNEHRIAEIMRMCWAIKLLSSAMGISAPGSEWDLINKKKD